MSERQRLAAERRAAHWLESGPEAAPAYLLSVAMARISGIRQRPGWLASALGTPGWGAGTRPVVSVRVALIGAALFLASLLGAALIAGSIRPDVDRDRDFVTAPTERPGPTLVTLPSDRPSASPDASTAPQTRPSLAPLRIEQQVEFPALGFTAIYAGSPGFGRPWTAWGTAPAPEEGAITFPYGSCVDNLCPGYVIVSSAPVGTGTIVRSSDEPAAASGSDVWDRIDGASLDELQASWTSVIGSSTFDRVVIGGQNGILAEGNGARAILAVHARRVFALVGGKIPFAGNSTSRLTLETFLAGFDFYEPPPDPVGTRTVYTINGAPEGAFAVSSLNPDLAPARSLTNGISVPIDFGVTSSFDPYVAAYAEVTVRSWALVDAQTDLLLERRSILALSLDVGADPALLIRGTVDHPASPVALVAHGNLVYRIEVRRVRPPSTALPPASISDEDLLRRFLTDFEAIDVAAPA